MILGWTEYPKMHVEKNGGDQGNISTKSAFRDSITAQIKMLQQK